MSSPLSDTDSMNHKNSSICISSGGLFSFDKCHSCGEIGKQILHVMHNLRVYYEACDSEECLEKCRKMVVTEQKKDYVFGQLYYLKDKVVKVRQCNGDIDDGWVIHPGITTSSKGDRIIKCTKPGFFGSDEMYVSVDIILELNPSLLLF